MGHEIRTNHVPRLLDSKKPEWSEEEEDCFTYKGETYFISEFERSNIPGWDGIHCDTFFSAIIIRFPRDDRGCEDTDRVIVGLYFETSDAADARRRA